MGGAFETWGRGAEGARSGYLRVPWRRSARDGPRAAEGAGARGRDESGLSMQGRGAAVTSLRVSAHWQPSLAIAVQSTRGPTWPRPLLPGNPSSPAAERIGPCSTGGGPAPPRNRPDSISAICPRALDGKRRAGFFLIHLPLMLFFTFFFDVARPEERALARLAKPLWGGRAGWTAGAAPRRPWNSPATRRLATPRDARLSRSHLLLRLVYSAPPLQRHASRRHHG